MTALSSVYSSVHKPRKQTSFSLFSDFTDWILPAGLWAGLIISVVIILAYVYWKTKSKSRRTGAYYVSPMVQCNTASHRAVWNVVSQKDRIQVGGSALLRLHTHFPTSSYALARSKQHQETACKSTATRGEGNSPFPRISLTLSPLLTDEVLNSKNDTPRDDTGTRLRMCNFRYASLSSDLTSTQLDLTLTQVQWLKPAASDA